MQINGVDYGRAKLGIGSSWGKKQSRFVAGNGAVRVRDKSVEDALITFTLPRLTLGQFYQLRFYLTQTVDYARESFSIIDDWGIAFTVRWWDSKLKFVEKAGRFYKVTMTVRVEN